MKSMSHPDRCCSFNRLFVLGISLLVMVLVTSHAASQTREGHPLYPAGLPTGYVGQGALLQPLPMRGYFQPVKVTLPEGAGLAFAVNNAFADAEASPVQAGLLVGHVYRFRVTEIPYNFGAELYPTLEIINRLYPPPGRENEFPVEVEITQEDLEIALSGRLVTRVIYLEDPMTALATRGEEKATLTKDLEPAQNPLTAARQVGRPMAILRMGNRQLTPAENTPAFFFGSPPWQSRAPQQPLPLQSVEIEAQSGTKIIR